MIELNQSKQLTIKYKVKISFSFIGVYIHNHQLNLEICFDYLKKEGFTIKEAEEISRLILKETPFTLEGQILYDVDVLDYNRFFWFPQEENLFDQSKLIVASERDLTDVVDVSFRKQLIQLAQDLVVFAENIQVNTPTSELINKVYTFYLDINNL